MTWIGDLKSAVHTMTSARAIQVEADHIRLLRCMRAVVYGHDAIAALIASSGWKEFGALGVQPYVGEALHRAQRRTGVESDAVLENDAFARPPISSASPSMTASSRSTANPSRASSSCAA